MTDVRYGSTFDDLCARIAHASPGRVDEVFVPRTGALVAAGTGEVGGERYRQAIRALAALDDAVAGVLAAAVVSDVGSTRPDRHVELVFPTLGRSPLWEVRIRQPDLVTPAVLDAARSRLERADRETPGVGLRHHAEGLCVQTLCTGSGTHQGAVALLSNFARSRGYLMRDSRQEVHRLRGTDPSFVLRYAVHRRDGSR